MFKVAAQATPSIVSCLSATVAAGDSTQCNVTLSKPAPKHGVRLQLATSSQTLQVPSTVFIPEGQASIQFSAQANISEQDENVVLSAASDSESGATSLSLRTIKPIALSCAQTHVATGNSVMCDLQLSSTAISDSLVFKLSSSSQGLKIPAQVSTRTGQSRIRFQAAVDAATPQGTAVIEARLAEIAVQETLGILSPGMLHLIVLEHFVGQTGSVVRFTAVARDGQNLPLTVFVSGQPVNAVFDATTGAFEWLPAEGDLGRHQVTFKATNAVGASTSKTMTIDIDSDRPTVASVQNGASSSTSSACSPGSIATVVGTFLSRSDLAAAPNANSDGVDHTRVQVNGSDVSVLSAAKDHVDFVCPMVAPGTPLDIAVETESGLSNTLRSKMEDVAPGIFTADGSGVGQALAWRTGSSDLALVPSFRFQGKPALPGDKVSVLVTGINCIENFGSDKASMNLGSMYVPIDSLASSAQKPGACEVGITIPEGIYGDAVSLTLNAMRTDGRNLTSNIASIAIDNKPK